MRMPRLIFEDHAAFHRDVLGMTVGGALGGLAWWVLAAGSTGLAAWPWLGTTLVTLGAGCGPGVARRELRTTLLGGLAGGLAALTFTLTVGREPLLAGLLCGGLLGLPLALRFRPLGLRWAGVLGSAALAMAAMLVTGGPDGAWRLGAAALPGWLTQTLGTASYAFLVGFGSIAGRIGRGDHGPRRVALGRPVPLALPDGVPENLRSFAEEARSTRARIAVALARHTTGDRELLQRIGSTSDALAARVVDQIRRWHEVEQSIEPGAQERLGSRIAFLQERIDRSTDETARQGFTAARDALVSQLELHRRLDVGRERLHARLHQHLATLEKLYLTLVNLSSADAQRFSGEVRPLLDDAGDLAQEVDILSEVDEVFSSLEALPPAGDTAAPASVPRPPGQAADSNVASP